MILKLLNTTVFRLSLLYALLFSLIAAGAMRFIYWKVEAEIKQQTDTRLLLESDILVKQFKAGQLPLLLKSMNARNGLNDSYIFIYTLINRHEKDLSVGFDPDYISVDGKRGFTTMQLNKIMPILPNKFKKDDDMRVLLTLLPNDYQLIVAIDLQDQKKLLDQIYSTVIIAILVMFVLVLIVGGVIGYSVLRRIDLVQQTAGDIIKGDLSQRMPITCRHNEFDRLGHVLNAMLDRIEQLMQSMREVTDNLAHDLRNPLNRLRNRLEITLLKDPDKADYQQSQQQAIEDVDQLIKTFNALLSIAQAESSVHQRNWADVKLDNLINELAELYAAVSEERDIQFKAFVEENLILSANRQLLAQALTNLLDNAVKYTPSQGHISIEVKKQDDAIQIIIADSGLGIPKEKHKEVFKRFIRLDNARSSAGNGLGLSLVKAVVDLHDANIELFDNHPGLKVVLSFKCVH